MRLPEAGEIRTLLERWGKRIFQQTYTFPDGRKDDFLIFGTTKNVRPVIVFPLTANKEVIAVRQFRIGANALVLELPGGNPKPGQTAEDVLRAELVEETGYRPGEIVPFNQKQMWFEPASMRVSYVPFLALNCVFEKEPTPEQNEVIEVVKIPYETWIELIRSGGVKDDKTIAITFLADLYLREND